MEGKSISFFMLAIDCFVLDLQALVGEMNIVIVVVEWVIRARGSQVALFVVMNLILSCH